MKALKLFALSYLVKTILVGIAWLFIPDLPQRTATFARETWGKVSSGWRTEVPAAVVAPSVAPGRTK